jgi:hypothetical protein
MAKIATASRQRTNGHRLLHSAALGWSVFLFVLLLMAYAHIWSGHLATTKP